MKPDIPKAEGGKHRIIGIRPKLVILLGAFVAALLAILWIVQTVFLGDIYRNIKVREMESASEYLRRELTEYGTVSDSTVNTLSENNQICIDILDSTFSSILSDTRTFCYTSVDPDDCFVHQMMAARNDSASGYFQDFRSPAERIIYTMRLTFLASVRQSGEVYFAETSAKGDQLLLQNGADFSGTEQDTEDDLATGMLYIEYIDRNDTGYYLILNTKITPVNATVSTLRLELTVISVIFILAAVIMALILSKSISAPIVKINTAARQLATGDYNTVFAGDGYREIAELRDTLNYASAELSKVEGFRRELLANVSHDLRTPLTMITGYAEVMRDLPDENTPENVQIIIDEANRLTTLVNDLLDLSKLQSGAATMNATVFSLTDCIQSINRRYQKLKENDGYQIDFFYDTDVRVRADYPKIQQVIYNLVNNAISYTGEDKVVRISQTATKTDSGKDAVRVSVSDTGSGISKENLTYIWDRYFKENKTHKRAVVGTGLGLSIVKGVLRMHGAKFGVETSEDPVNHGSTFWFELETTTEEPDDISV